MALASALALMGCGGGDSTAGTDPASLTRAQWVKKGNAICAEVFGRTTKQYSKLRDLNGGRATSGELNRAAQKFMVPALRELEQRLEALGSPRSDGQRVEKMLTTFEEAIEIAAKDASTVRGETGPFAFGETYEQMWAYGLDECGLS